MSSNLNTSQQRDGTSRKQRMPEALHPDYAPVDGRSREDLLAFAQALSAEIRYYDESNTEDGNWEAFFADDVADSEPHKALFITFLELFKYAQAHLNTLTQRHMDFYYREVLRLKEKPATPDQVHVLFQLAKNVKSHLLEAGTLLKAGKDDTGVPLYYATEKDIVINRATIGSLKTLFLEKDNGVTQNIYAAPVADSVDGLGMPFKTESPKWSIFGDVAKGEKADIGFAIASLLLILNEGRRKIDILLSFSDTVPAEVGTLTMADTFDIQFSSEKEWITGTIENYSDPHTSEQTGISVVFDETQPAITAYNRETHGGRFTTLFPVVQLLLKDHSKYDLLYPLELTAVDITVNVTGVKNLVLQNDQGALSPAKPFMPFGSQPILGSSFYIGSGEVFQKRLERLTLNIDWLDAPADFHEHYTGYGNIAASGAAFRADISLLHQKKWQTPLLYQNFGLFTHTGAITNISALLGPGYEHGTRPEPITAYDQHTRSGFIKMELTGPSSPFRAFGHREYPHLLTQQTIALANGGSGLPSNAPYTPIIKFLSLDYRSTQTIPFTGGSTPNVAQFFHIRPFGHHQYEPGDSPSLLPQYPDEGNLYIGIKDLDPPQQLSILFRPAEGSSNPDVDIRPDDIHWGYLSDGQWTALAEQQLVSDTTQAFQATGIITFNIPTNASQQDSMMPEGLYWLRASLREHAKSTGKFIALNTQAVTAVFTDRGNDLSRLNRPLEADSISGLASKRSAVKSVTQPYPSFNGIATERHETFYTRISERLRHKAKAVSGWDYERLVLEEFPSIYKVKSLDHTEIDVQDVTNSSEDRAGHVTLVVIPKPNPENAANPLEPKASSKTLMAISDSIRNYTSPFVRLEVRSPRYEPIQLRFKIRFNGNADQGYYLQLLEEEITRFLAPWAYEDEAEIAFGNAVHKSAVLDFVEKRPYVDVVIDFVMYHIFEAVLPGSNDEHPVEGEQDVYHIFHYYPAVPGQEIALDFTAGFNGVANISGSNSALRERLNGYFANLTAEVPLGTVQRADLINFIEKEGQISFVRDLRLFHITGTTLKEDTERALADRPGAILTSAATHDIGLLDIDYECPGGTSIGIGDMIVEGDFIVETSIGVGDTIVGGDFIVS